MKRRVVSMKNLEAFEAYLWANEKELHTIKKYLRDLRKFMEYAGQRTVCKELVLAYKHELARQYAVSSTNSMLAALNSFCRFMEWDDCYVRQFRVQKRSYCSLEKELSREEYYQLIETAEQRGNQRLSLLIQTICSTGIRVSELEYVTVEAVRRGEAVVFCKGKTRRVFIVSGLRKKLLIYARRMGIQNGFIFVTNSGRPMHRSNIWREMKTLCMYAGIRPEKVYPHNLRHLFARTFYKNEKDIAQLADILGHSNINTTRIYMISTGAEHRKKMERMRLVT